MLLSVDYVAPGKIREYNSGQYHPIITVFGSHLTLGEESKKKVGHCFWLTYRKPFLF